jgi:sugar lactone lactonase YvrE
VKGGILTTVAGTGTEMYEGNGEGGPATAAIIMNPAAVTADTLGNFYFVDEGPYLRKVSQGILTTIGEIAPGLLVFTQAAKIISPSGSGVILGLAASSTGDVYFTETLDHTVHKLSGGAITVVAGTGKAGYSGDNGPAQNAQLNSPAGLAVDDADNLYIADQNNGAIRKVANGTITTVAAPFEEPSQVAVDREGNVFVIDGMAVLKASDGVITTLVEGITAPEYGRVAPRAQLGHPNGLAVDRAGCVYVSDSLNNRILVLIPPPGGAPSVHPDGRLPGSTVDLRSACAAAAMQ